MQIAVITTPREPSYLDETIRQIRRGIGDDEVIDIFCDDPRHHPKDTCQDPFAQQRWMPGGLWKIARGMRRYQRACLNFLGALLSDVGEIVIFEDDVEVKPTWLEVLQAVSSGPSDAVSMYWPDADHLAPGEPLGVAPFQCRAYRRPATVHGSLGVWLSARSRVEVASLIQNRLLDQLSGGHPLLPFDNCVAAWLNETDPYGRGRLMVATVPALVDHRGEVSAIEENRYHGLRKSPGF